MYDHENYAQAFVASSQSDTVKYYLEFKEMVDVFRQIPQFVDALLFSRERFEKFDDEFKARFSPLVYNFLKIVIEDGLIEQLFKIEISVRDILVKQGDYNYCVIESSEQLSEAFNDKLVSMIQAKTNGNVEIVHKIRPELKSGIRMYLNNESIDLSITGRLERLLSEVS